ncbi:MAG TPA: heme A synthase, partial [Rhodospirillaceae bacterium]|nr:heme A synthase [Rhodospirillaceae bacterium]
MKSPAPHLSRWLFFCCFLVGLIIIVGAITRLSGSGLSIVEWKPLMGALPPLNEAQWQHVFDLYKQSPQYIKENSWMSLADFKAIFFWEWFHRLLGRLIGLAYALPLLWFFFRKQIPSGAGIKLIGVLLLGGAQGFMGWYMVKSGL